MKARALTDFNHPNAKKVAKNNETVRRWFIEMGQRGAFMPKSKRVFSGAANRKPRPVTLAPVASLMLSKEDER